MMRKTETWHEVRSLCLDIQRRFVLRAAKGQPSIAATARRIGVSPSNLGQTLRRLDILDEVRAETKEQGQ